MGGDGGQVIDRATMVRTRGWGLTKEAGGRYNNSLGEMNSYLQMVTEDRGLGSLERHRMRMTSCWLSQEALREPIVACRLGNLYNKEAVIQALLNKAIPEAISHIRALKDVKNCMITWKEAENEEGRRRMVCPVTRDDLDTGGSKAVVIWPSGAVVSPKALKELKLKECPVTGKAFDAEADVVPLAPEGEELEKLRERLPASKKRKAEAGPSASSGARPAKSARQDDDRTDGKSEVFQKLFTRSTGDGMTGTRDALALRATTAARGSSEERRCASRRSRRWRSGASLGAPKMQASSRARARVASAS
eukprot:CAMPEP_0176232130 /NCGR_PEP_ID=MMETSP0121_2-20121125/25154_1 /TAXON_ID=160619 /ORGANISM="Kryptoperidinium foliaceum, Strain CCMP 1326" /LENGTH=305 /DNA_ID=CAMNT_0017571491 /DNA_START=98 /DNA_END=1013 /DNA_ORIENTATION=+